MIGSQLLLNYCFGHARSTLLLCPYGSGPPYINHSGDSPNAKIVWADNSIVHHKDWLKKPIDFLDGQDVSGLEFDFVATRDIEPEEEIFIDYGSEWEDGWDRHVRDWKPVPDAESYTDAKSLNCFGDDCIEKKPIRTEAEEIDDPYPENIGIRCHYRHKKGRSKVWNAHRDNRRFKNVPSHACKVLSRKEDETDGTFVYTCALTITKEEDDEEVEVETIVVKQIPQHGIRFINKPYTSDLFLPNAFRHEMMIPDDMMPDAWKNKDP